MDFNIKRCKLSTDFESQISNSLNALCSNFSITKIAIEFHDDVVKNITYGEIITAKKEIEDTLIKLLDSQFIAVDLEIQDFCIPAIILGIISSGRGFINISPTSQDTCFRLKIIYFFTQSSTPNTELIHKFNIHGETIYLRKFKNNIPIKSDFEKDRFAYAITTSGTTGVPKIVKVLQESITFNILDLKKIFSISSEDKIAQLTPLTFDPSIVEIFLGLSSNCTLFMASKNLKNNPRKMMEIMHSQKVTLIQTTPSLLFGKFSKRYLKSQILGEESNLRILVLGGESFPKKESLRNVRHEKNQTRIFNIYGITEVSCWASVEEFYGEKIDDICNGFLGRTLSETCFQVRTEDDKIVENGEGVLFIGSRKRICLVDDEEINSSTVSVFRNTGDIVTIDNSRRVFYKGRHNKVIKRFGNKVDLSELESVVSQLTIIQNCFAIWDEKDQKLHVCVSTIENFEEEDNKVKLNIMNHLRTFSSFYHPDEIHLINNFPLTVNGKICLRSLKKICREKINEKTSPLNVENILRNIWKLYAGSFESFVKSGGNSVTALQIVNSVSEKCNREFPELIGMLLNDASFSDCVAHVENQIKNEFLPMISEINFERAKNLESKVTTLRNRNIDSKMIESTSAENTNIENRKFESTSTESRKVKNTNIDNKGVESGNNENTKIENTNIASSSHVREKKFENLINSEESPNAVLWQKCRGYTSNEDAEKDHEILLKKNIRFQLSKSFDLKKCVDASPTVFQYSNGKIFATVGSHSGIIITVEINSNSYEKYITKLPDRIESSVLVFDQFRGIVGCYDGNVYCLNLKTGDIFWKFQTGDAVKSTATTCLEKKNIFIGSYDRYMYCLSLETGKEFWRMKASEGSISGTARLHYESKSLLFGTLDGTCVNLDQISGKIKWQHSFSDPVFSAPAILETGNVVFASVTGKLECFNIQSGQKLWTYAINGNIFSHLVIVKSLEQIPETIIFGSRNKTLYELNCSLKPSLKFSHTTENPIIATPWNAGKLILIASIDGTLQIIDSESREILTTQKLSGEIFSSPILYKDLVIVGCRDNKLYVFKLV